PTQHPAEVATVAIRRHHHRRPPGTELAMTLHVAADELLQELARMEATMAVVARHAGMGHAPDLERRLDTHLRALRVLLDPNGVAVAEDTVDAAKRALDCADPAAPLLV